MPQREPAPAAGRVVLRASSSPPPEAGPPRTPWWRRGRRPLVLGALAAVVLAGWGTDDFLAHREVDRLLVGVTAARGTLDLADRRISGISGYVAPTLGSSDVPDSVTDQLLAVIDQTAAEQAPLVRARAGAVRSVPVLPWHHATSRARQDYAAYLEARATVYATPRSSVAGANPGTVALRARALASLQAAVGPGQAGQVQRLVGAAPPVLVDSPAALHRPVSP